MEPVKKVKCQTKRGKKKPNMKHSISNLVFTSYLEIIVEFNSFKQSGFSVIELNGIWIFLVDTFELLAFAYIFT